MNKKETKAKFDSIMDQHLNGEWKLFVDSCDEIKCKLDELSLEEIKELREQLKTRLNEV
jgi:hypothetical protein